MVLYVPGQSDPERVDLHLKLYINLINIARGRCFLKRHEEVVQVLADEMERGDYASLRLF